MNSVALSSASSFPPFLSHYRFVAFAWGNKQNFGTAIEQRKLKEIQLRDEEKKTAHKLKLKMNMKNVENVLQQYVALAHRPALI